MDTRFRYLGCGDKVKQIATKNFGNPNQIGEIGAVGGFVADTTLRLYPPGSSSCLVSASKGIKRKWCLVDGSLDSSLCLRLGNSSSSSDSKGSSATACTSMSSAKETDEESSMDLELEFSLHLGNEKNLIQGKAATSILKAVDDGPRVDLGLSLSGGPAESEITTFHPSSTSSGSFIKMPQFVGSLHYDEESTSSRWKAGRVCHPSIDGQNAETGYHLSQTLSEHVNPATVSPDLSSSIMTIPKSSVTCTSGITQQQQQRSSSTKQCQFKGCAKGARGASGLCIAHGGGRRCQKLGCHKGAEGRTAFCKAHGGGRRCEYLGCTKSAEGRTDFCIAHGGGRRCSHEGCTRAARGKSGLCIRHGGGKRCQRENCTKSAEGLSGLCISHGGGRRCQFPMCSKGAQGSTMFCKAHGGGKRCTFEGCTKGAEGSTPYCKGHGGGKRCSFQGGGVCPKSVHGGTLFCVAHGGGKRCAVPECTKSARGRTDFCVRHGGGKRCKYGGCGKSAQGSTDFCKAHGGGKRCSWGQPGSQYGRGDGPCNSFARAKTGLCVSHGALVQDKRVHGGAGVGVMFQDRELCEHPKVRDLVGSQRMSFEMMKTESSAITCASRPDWNHFGAPQVILPPQGGQSSGAVTGPEGRVHGGGLMAMLTNSSGFNMSSNRDVSGLSEQSMSFTMRPNWM